MEQVGQGRPTPDSPVPSGITGAFRRLLQAYRSYRSAVPNSATPDAQQDNPTASPEITPAANGARLLSHSSLRLSADGGSVVVPPDEAADPAGFVLQGQVCPLRQPN
jgi:hypothetical protein